MGELDVVPQDLGRVFLNIVNNAGHATNDRRRATPGAGRAGGPYSPTVWLTTKREQDHLEVRIRDNGTGMPPDVIEKIFNPFFTTKPTDQGTGLGLSLSSDIVRSHGGTIRVESVEGEYTEMIVELPSNAPPKQSPNPQKSPPDPSHAHKARTAEGPSPQSKGAFQRLREDTRRRGDPASRPRGRGHRSRLGMG